jgi:NAD-dependent DNA ligase
MEIKELVGKIREYQPLKERSDREIGLPDEEDVRLCDLDDEIEDALEDMGVFIRDSSFAFLHFQDDTIEQVLARLPRGLSPEEQAIMEDYLEQRWFEHEDRFQQYIEYIHGKVFAFTGTLDHLDITENQARAFVEQVLQGTVSPTVSKNVNLLVIGISPSERKVQASLKLDDGGPMTDLEFRDVYRRLVGDQQEAAGRR